MKTLLEFLYSLFLIVFRIEYYTCNISHFSFSGTVMIISSFSSKKSAFFECMPVVAFLSLAVFFVTAGPAFSAQIARKSADLISLQRTDRLTPDPLSLIQKLALLRNPRSANPSAGTVLIGQQSDLKMKYHGVSSVKITKLELVVPSHNGASAPTVLPAIRVVDPSDPEHAVSNPIAAFARISPSCLDRLDRSFADMTQCLAGSELSPSDFLPIRRFKSATPNAVLGAQLGETTVALVAMRLPEDVVDPVHSGSVHLFGLTPEGGLVDYVQFTVEEIPRSQLYAIAGSVMNALAKAAGWKN